MTPSKEIALNSLTSNNLAWISWNFVQLSSREGRRNDEKYRAISALGSPFHSNFNKTATKDRASSFKKSLQKFQLFKFAVMSIFEKENDFFSTRAESLESAEHIVQFFFFTSCDNLNIVQFLAKKKLRVINCCLILKKIQLEFIIRWIDNIWQFEFLI